jgi:tocopherol O-methyltransferase
MKSSQSGAAKNYSAVAEFYEMKTGSILKRYGPGPRVHYHTGFFEKPPSTDVSATDLKRQLVESQVSMISYAARTWNAKKNLCGDMLDVGCGLGGGSIYWAEECCANVTAVTNVRSHLELIMKFANQVGVDHKIRPLLSNAEEVPGKECYDAVVACESSINFMRDRWFKTLYRLLRPVGQVFIYDCFLENQKFKTPFDDYWHSRIGSVSEYLEDARKAGFRVTSLEDVTNFTAPYWSVSLALVTFEKGDKSESWKAHNLINQGLREGGLQHALISLVKH